MRAAGSPVAMPIHGRCNEIASASHGMLQLAHLVVAGPHRFPRVLHRAAAFAGEVVILECGFELALEVILAALHLIYDGLVVATGNRLFQIDESAVRAAGEAAVVGRIATEAAHRLLQPVHCPAPLL